MDELRKIMGLDGSYKVTKVEEKEDGKSTAKFIYLECISKKCKYKPIHFLCSSY